MKLLKPLAVAGLGLSASISSFAELEEIIVTATKREASVQEIPIAVTAMSGEAIAKAGINDVRDLSALSASFQANSSDSETGGTTFRIRGVGTTGNNIGLESAVGVFLDGVYLSRPAVALGDLVDVDRVEVLRGPQGTLFGRNTSAGALNIVTKKASLNETEFWANASFGNYDARSFQIGGTTPLIEDELGFRFSASKRDQDGFVESETSGAESVTRDRYSMRAELLWAPNDDMEIRVIGDYGETDENCCDGAILLEDSALIDNSLFAAAGLPLNGGVVSSGSDAFDDRESNGGGSQNEVEQFGLSAQLDWDLGFADLVGIVSYRQYENEGTTDSDFTGLNVFNIGTTFPETGKTEIDTWTAELRLQGATDRLDWMVGAYYSDETIDVLAPFQVGADYTRYISASTITGALGLAKATIPDYIANNGDTVVAVDSDGISNAVTIGDLDNLLLGQALGTGQDLVSALYGPNTTINGTGSVNQADQDAQSWSFYTHNTFAINEQLDFVFGLRWSDEEKESSLSQLRNTNTACAAGTQRIKAANGGAPLGLALGGVQVLGCFFPVAPLPSITTGAYDEDYHDEELTYTAKLVYQINESSSTYLSYTHGFKAGGFNIDATAAARSAAAPTGADPRFDSEEIDSIELGYKADLFDNRLRANIAIFHSEIEDFQVLEFTGIQFVTFNVPKVFSSGIETEFLLSAFDDLDISLAMTYTDARYPDQCDNNIPNDTVSRLCGNDLTNAPEFVGVLGASYNTLIPGTDLAFFANGSIRYEAERRTSTQAITDDGIANPRDIQSGHSKTNLRMGVTSVDGKWTVELWGKNLTDKQTRNVTFNIPLRGDARGAFFDAPRTYGLTLRTQF